MDVQEYRDDYKEYETPIWLQKLWTDWSQVGPCHTCGSVNFPVEHSEWQHKNTCVWCLETLRLRMHLFENTTRQKSKPKRNSFLMNMWEALKKFGEALHNPDVMVLFTALAFVGLLFSSVMYVTS